MGKQRYKCHSCQRVFVSVERVDPGLIWEDYHKGKQTYTQLAEKYGCSERTIQRRLDKVEPSYNKTFPSETIVVMDTTFFGRGFGVMVFKDSQSRTILYKKYVKSETNSDYVAGIEEIFRRGIRVEAIVCDGRKGLFNLFPDIPIQMCHFHQVAIIRRYLTKRPKLPAGKELTAVTQLLVHLDRETFEAALNEWFVKWKAFLNERKTDEHGKSRYVHKRLRSAYRSLKNNLPWLFTYSEYKHLQIPNTTNALDGTFADLKNKLRNHNGLSLTRKKRFIDEFFKA